MRCGSQARTSGGNAGCITATPNAVNIVVANSNNTSGTPPRNTEPSAVANNPITKVESAPNRAISSDPGMAAAANRTAGSPPRMPTSVADMCRSAANSGMIGGTARTVMRKPLPASQSKATRSQSWPAEGGRWGSGALMGN